MKKKQTEIDEIRKISNRSPLKMRTDELRAERESAENFAALVRKRNALFCTNCGSVFPRGTTCCRGCGGRMVAPSADNVIACRDMAWTIKIFKCGACIYGGNHELPFKCILGMSSPGNDCETGIQLLAEAHQDMLTAGCP